MLQNKAYGSQDEPESGRSRHGARFLQIVRDLMFPGDAVVATADVKAALTRLKGYFISVGVFSFTINLLVIATSMYTLELYDRVLPSHSVPTLVALVILILFVYGFQVLLEGRRSRLLARVGRHLDLSLRQSVFDVYARSNLPGAAASAGTIVRDLDQVRTFLASQAPATLFDLPWTPVFLLLMFLLHPLLGAVGIVGAAVLALLAYLTERSTAPLQKDAMSLTVESGLQNEAVRGGAETLLPLGMLAPVGEMWTKVHQAAGESIIRASDTSTHYGGLSRFFRLSLQSLVMSLGAYLVIMGQATGGVMIMSSILLGRMLSPVELAIIHWRNLVSAQQAYRRLRQSLSERPKVPATVLPIPSRTLKVENLQVAIERQSPVLSGIDFELVAGDILGIIGSSGAGKSTLARSLAGVWPATKGSIRFDGATSDQWSDADLGRFMGYLPQTVTLFRGTVAQNISRFQADATSEAMLDAARQARIETLVKGLDGGFDTEIQPQSGQLSAGQRQRVALARALYGNPFILVLDEPNSALDAEGEAALLDAILAAKSRGAIVIIITHRPAILQIVTKILVLNRGRQTAFGPRDQIAKQAKDMAAPAQRSRAFTVIPGDGND